MRDFIREIFVYILCSRYKHTKALKYDVIARQKSFLLLKLTGNNHFRHFYAVLALLWHFYGKNYACVSEIFD